jgi:PhnB protein
MNYNNFVAEQTYYLKLKRNTMASICPYLTFNGNCKEAFDFYKSVFGGDYPYVGTYKDMPAEFNVPESDKGKIMHISLPISKETFLYGADSSGSFGGVYQQGNNVSISLNTDSEGEANKLFNGLSAGGKVTMPLDKTFWGALFGMFTDKFGIHWMVNHDLKK